MERILQFLNNAKVFYLATTDNGKPVVRPFGAVTLVDGTLWFCTGKTKQVYKQMVANPYICISAFNGEDWIRISGKAVFEDNRKAKEAILEDHPSLKVVYKADDDDLFGSFKIENMEVVLHHYTTGEKERLA